MFRKRFDVAKSGVSKEDVSRVAVSRVDDV